MNTQYYYYRLMYNIYDEQMNLKGFNTIRLVDTETIFTPERHLQFELNLQSLLETIFDEIRRNNLKIDENDNEYEPFKFLPNLTIRMINLEELCVTYHLNTDYIQIKHIG